MKKLVSLLLALLMLMGIMAVPTMAADEVSVYLFGEKLEFDVPAQIVNGRTLVPVRKIFESLGYQVDWNNDTRTAIATSTERTINITIDSYIMYVNEEIKMLDVPACIIDGRTLVPARAIAEASGYKVDWDENTRSVLITQLEKDYGPYNELKEIILRDGYYDNNGNYTIEYEMNQEYVGITHHTSGEYISVNRVSVNSYGYYYVISVVFYENEAPLIIFDYPFDSEAKGTVYGKYDKEDGMYSIITTNLTGENLSAAIDMITDTEANYFDPVLAEMTGFKLADFGIAY